MPFYEYVCSACGAETEVLQKLSDPPETECPVCHAQALHKNISAAGFRLKGGGWYETDFKSDSKRNLASDAAPETSKEGAKEGAKADGHVHSASCGCGPKTTSEPAIAAATTEAKPAAPAAPAKTTADT